MLHSDNAEIQYGNGDSYKGVISQGRKNGAGGVYTYRNGDVYEGRFQNDRKSDQSGKMKYGRLDVQYYGEFKDDRKIGKGVLEFGENGQLGFYKGELDSNEELCGKNQTFEFPQQKMVYTGDFSKNQFHGDGQIHHQDTGNVFKGQFLHGYKHGRAQFILSEASKLRDGKAIFKGVFEYNLEIRKESNYGLRY